MQPAPMVLRRAALARISSWLSGDGRFLLVTGSMGSGKSVLARQLADALRAEGRVHAEHFCAADNTVTIAVNALLDSWSTQLRRQLPGYHQHLAQDMHITGTASGPRST